MALAAAIAGCANESPEKAPLHDEDLFEVVFRYQFRRQQTAPPAYYLKVLDSDPSAAFLARFADLPIEVKKGSEYDEEVPGYFWLERAVWDSSGKARVTTYATNGFLAEGNTVLLEKKRGKWVVVQQLESFTE